MITVVVTMMVYRFLLLWLVYSLCILNFRTCSAFNNQQIDVDGKDNRVPAPVLDPCKKHTRSILHNKPYDVTLSGKQKMTRNEVLGRAINWPPEDNCTDDDITAVEPVVYDHWKLHIIMACTVTAAVEFVVIIFIILYWKQIRWTLRKLTCPCDDCREHEVMEPDQQGQMTEVQSDIPSDTQSYVQADIQLDTQQAYPIQNTTIGPGHTASNHTVHTFSSPWYSRVECSPGDGEDLAIPGPSGLSSTFEILIHHSSGSDSDDESLVQVKPQRTVPTKKHIKGAKGQRVKSAECSHLELKEVSRSDDSEFSGINHGTSGGSHCSQCASDQSSPITHQLHDYMTDCGQTQAGSEC